MPIENLPCRQAFAGPFDGESLAGKPQRFDRVEGSLPARLCFYSR
jgi:hypothetical protein